MICENRSACNKNGFPSVGQWNVALRALQLCWGGGVVWWEPPIAILATKHIKRCYNWVAICKEICNPDTVGWYIPNLTVASCKIILLYWQKCQTYPLLFTFFHGFKNRTKHQTIFFLNFRFNPGFWPVLRVLTGPDWLPVPSWTGRTGRSGSVFKTVHFFISVL